jgi:LacI family transcriptional regulator
MGIVRYAREAGWIVDSRLIAFHAIAREREYLLSSHFDGVITMTSKMSPWIQPLVASLNVPVVNMWVDFPEFTYPKVLLDHAAIGRMAAEHLLSKGFRDLLFYTHAIEGQSTARRSGFQTTVLAAGANYHELIWDHNIPLPEGDSRVSWLATYLVKAPKPLAVLGMNDHIAVEVLEAAEHAGLQVPREIAVMGVDNDPLVTEVAPVPLTSIDSARDQVGYQAAALLDRMMRGEEVAGGTTFVPPARVVPRRSTDVLAVQDRDVALAIQFIQENYTSPITVDHVADCTAVSRRHLQDRFFKATGKTVSDAILNQRIEHAKKLLCETNNKIQSVAHLSGFHTAEHLSKIFRKFLDMTPQQYRQRYASYGPNPVHGAPVI